MRHNAITRRDLAAFALMLLPAHMALAFPPPDNTPPAAVTTLAVPATSYASISYSWTAVGDDGGGAGQCSGAGTAKTYDFRYSTTAPGGDLNAWFNAASQAAGEPAPKACGSAESFCLSGLAPGTTYFAALKVKDEKGNTSPLSNVVSAAAGADIGVMHVTSIVSSWSYAGGAKKRGQAFVTVVDAFGSPVPCATVTVQWAGCYDDTASGVSDHTGLARIVSNKTANCLNTNCCFFVTVTNVTHAGLTYDAGANIQTSDGGECAPLYPPACAAAAMACPGDFDGDGVVGGEDLVAFLDALLGDEPGEFHVGGDPHAQSLELLAFMAALAEGCP